MSQLDAALELFSQEPAFFLWVNIEYVLGEASASPFLSTSFLSQGKKEKFLLQSGETYGCKLLGNLVLNLRVDL